MRMFTDNWDIISRAIEIFKNRNKDIFTIGLVLFLMGLFFFKFLKHSESKIAKRFYRVLLLFGIIAMVFSLSRGSGLGLGPGGDSLIPSLIEPADKENEIVIEIVSKEISVEDETFENVSALESYLEDTYKDGCRITLIDNYAEHRTFEEIEQLLDQKTYSYEIVSLPEEEMK